MMKADYERVKRTIRKIFQEPELGLSEKIEQLEKENDRKGRTLFCTIFHNIPNCSY